MSNDIFEKTEKISDSNTDNINTVVVKGNDETIIVPSNVNIEEDNDINKNSNEKYQSPIGISKKLSQIKSDNKKVCYGLSPISEIVLNMSDTNIDGTTPSKNFGYKKQLINNEKQSINNEENVSESDNLCAKMTTNSKDIKDESKSDDENLISNNFTLNSTTSTNIDSSNVNSNNRNIAAARRLAVRGAHILNYSTDDSNDTNNSSINMNNNIMSIDDISFYDDITTGTTTIRRNLFDNNDNIRNELVNNNNNDNNENINNCNNNNGLLSNESSPQRFIVRKNSITVVDRNRSIDEIDNNSIDSGYGTFKFTEPKLPKKQLQLEPSIISSIQYNETISPKQFRIFHSLSSGSMESMDDEYITDLIEMESLEDDNEKFPTNLNSLISGHIKTIKTTPEMKRSTVRRCLSLNETNIQINNNRLVRGGLFEQPKTIIKSPKSPELLKPIRDLSLNITPYLSKQYELQQQQRIGCFKRPEPPCFSPIQSKRYKTESITDEKENLQENNNINKQQLQRQRPILRKSMSLNDAQIMTALARSTSEPDLIGDFSKPFCLPLMDGRHSDLKSISCETVARLIKGEFKDTINSYKIIDCRYPYEFDGGHINGAQNLYTQEQVLNELVKCKTDTPTVQPDGPKRNILIFHCEFSSERGPKLSRFLRNHDRDQNSNAYPALYYPEIYLLHNGYKEFYENYSNLCYPVAYRPMLEPSFGDLYRQFRAKSKSWNGDIKASGSKIGLKKSRSRLVL